MDGWIKLHRKFLDWGWIDEPVTLWLFIRCLLMANHTTKNWHGITIDKGSFVTSYKNLASKEAHVSVQQVRTSLDRLKSTGEITIKTNNKYTVVTICNWDKYQENNTQNNKQITRKQQTNNKQITTTKNEKNDKNLVTNVTSEISTTKDVVNEFISLFSSVNPSYKTLYPMKGQRLAVERLLNEHGREKVLMFIEGVKYAFGKPYAPSITTPYELERKLGALTAFLQREKWSDDNYKFSVTKV